LHSAVDFGITTPAVAILAAVVVAQLVALNRADPTEPPAAAHADVVTLDFERAARRHSRRARVSARRSSRGSDSSAAPDRGAAYRPPNVAGILGRLAVGVTALLLCGVLVLHYWQADRVYRLKLA